MTDRLLAIHVSARAVQEVVVAKSLEEYNKTVMAKRYKPGDYAPLVPVSKPSKIKPRLLGPFKVIEAA